MTIDISTLSEASDRFRSRRLAFPLVVVALLFVFASGAMTANQDKGFPALYADFLEAYWHPAITINGIETTVFDYALMAEDARRPGSLFERMLTALDTADPSALDYRERKAFWLNAYNFGAMRLIVDHYPVESIRSLKISLLRYPWSRPAVRVGGQDYTLKQIEKEILLKQYRDPRIVFAVSCAAVSCPDRTPSAFTANRLGQQLDDIIRRFMQNPTKGLQLDRETGTLTLSWIMKKDAHLFTQEKDGTIDFLLPYLNDETRRWLGSHTVRIDYFDHDWTLNDLAQSESGTE